MSGRSWAVTGISLVLVSLAVAFAWLHIASPSDGARMQPEETNPFAIGLALTPLEPSPGGLQKGDIVLAVAGRSVEAWAAGMFGSDLARPEWEYGDIVQYTVLREGQHVDVPVRLGRYPLGAILRQEWGALAGLAISFLVAAFVFARRPELPSARAWFLAAAGAFCSFPWAFGLTVNDLVSATGMWLYLLTTSISYLLFWIAGLHFALVFPRPHKLLNGRTWLVPSLYILPYLGYVLYAAGVWGRADSALAWFFKANTPVVVIQLIYLALLVGAAVSNYRTNRDTVSRQQARWVVYALALVGVITLAFAMIPETFTGRPLLSWNGVALMGLSLPLAIAIAILRYRLFDIDLIINRTLVYGALSAITMGLYIFIVGYLGERLLAGNHSVIAFLTTGLVAVIFQPLREWLQTKANRLMYGDRDDPYTVLSSLGKRLEASLAPERVLPIIVETIAQALKLPYVAIALRQEGDYKITASYGLSPSQNGLASTEVKQARGALEVLPLIYQSEEAGRLILGRRTRGEAFNAAEQRLLEDIAVQVSVAAYNVRLTEDLRRLAADLQRSRERLITAQEEERRRLRRDLHDGLGPQLASQALTLEAIEKSMQRNPQEATGMLRALKEQSRMALQEVRRLVYKLRPPALDDLGLVAALREGMGLYRQSGLQIELKADEPLPALPAAVELAAYRIVQEAVTNVAKHAQASVCEVRLSLHHQGGRASQENGVGGSLMVEVLDNGKGLPVGVKQGVGLHSMRERAEELGGRFDIARRATGGTRLTVSLPIAREDEPQADSGNRIKAG